MRMNRTSIPELSGTPLAAVLTSLSCHEDHCDSGDSFAERLISCAVIQRTLTGRATATVGASTYLHMPGRLFFLAARTQLTEAVAAPWHVQYLLLDGTWAEAIRTAMIERPERHLDAAFSSVVDALTRRPPGWAWQVAADLARLIGDRSEAGSGGGSDHLDRLGQAIDAHPERPWGLTALARTAAMRPRTLQALIAARTGEGPTRWALRRRLLHARALLQRGCGVAACADRLGFANPFHFSRCYRRVFGHPPSADCPTRLASIAPCS